MDLTPIDGHEMQIRATNEIDFIAMIRNGQRFYVAVESIEIPEAYELYKNFFKSFNIREDSGRKNY